MIVKDCLQDLFKGIDIKNPNQDIFNFVDSKYLDDYYIGMFGNRRVSDLVVNVDRLVIENIIINKYMNKWNNIILNYLDSENILENYKEVMTEINADIVNNDSTRTNTNKVSAFNDDDFVNNDEDLTIESINIVNDRNKEIIKTRIKETDFYNKVNKYLTEFDIYNIMIIDINNVVTMNILN